MTEKQPEALRLADALKAPAIATGALRHEIIAELRRLHALNQELLKALKIAVRQNSHDMMMTGEELRKCEAAIAKATGESK